MNRFKMISLLFAGLVVLQGPVFAEVIQGKVASMNPQENTLTVRQSDERGIRDISVEVTEDASFQGVSSLEQLSVGDEVVVSGDARGNTIEARSIDASGGTAGQHDWTGKLSRGLTNVVTSPLEIPRTINIQSEEKGPAVGWTGGLLTGVVKGFIRFGAGIAETFTFPFAWPNEGEQLVTPTYVWENWDGRGDFGDGTSDSLAM